MSALVLAVALGIAMRFLAIEAMEFKGDEFKALILAAAYLQEGVLPRVGLISSTGLFNPPFFLVLLWPPLLFSADPVVVTGWIVLLNAAGILGLLSFLRSIAGTRIALLTTATVALAPWLYVFSRKIWAQDALFPFLVLDGWFLVSYARDRKPWRLWAAALTVALTTQLHMSAWAMPVAAALWLLLLRVRPRWRDIGVCAAVFLLVYAPYISFHMDDAFRNLLRTTTQHPGSILDQLRWTIGINGAVGLDYLWGPSVPAAIPSWLYRAAEAGTWLVGASATAGLLLSVRRIIRASSRLRTPEALSPLDRYVLLLFCILALSYSGFLALGIPALPFYHLAFLPLIPLLCAIAVIACPRQLQLPMHLLLFAILTVFFALIITFRSLILHHPEQLTGDYGEPYFLTREQWEPYIEAIREGKLRLPEKQ